MAYSLLVLRDTLIIIGGIVVLYLITVVYTRRRLQRRPDAKNERIDRKGGLFDRKMRSRAVAGQKVGRDGRQGP
jgi:hypothetical protein